MRIPKDMPVLTLPSMQAMMCEDTRCITLAAFGSDDDLRSYLDGLSRKHKKKMVNNAEAITGMTPLLAACRRDAVEHVRILLAFGADPSTVRRLKSPALALARILWLFRRGTSIPIPIPIPFPIPIPTYHLLPGNRHARTPSQ